MSEEKKSGVKVIVLSDLHVQIGQTFMDKVWNFWNFTKSLITCGGERLANWKQMKTIRDLFMHLVDRKANGDLKDEEVVILITGDLVDDGTQLTQYKLLEESLRDLTQVFGDRVFCVPGNHDYGKGVGTFTLKRKSLSNFKKHVMGKEDVEFPVINKIGNVAFFGIDSMEGEFEWEEKEEPEKEDEEVEVDDEKVIMDLRYTDGKNGKIGEKQMNALQDGFTQYRDCFKVVYLHHHPVKGQFGNVLKDGEELVHVCEKDVDLMLYAHNHPTYVTSYKGNKSLSMNDLHYRQMDMLCVPSSVHVKRPEDTFKFQYLEIDIPNDKHGELSIHTRMVNEENEFVSDPPDEKRDNADADVTVEEEDVLEDDDKFEMEQ